MRRKLDSYTMTIAVLCACALVMVPLNRIKQEHEGQVLVPVFPERLAETWNLKREIPLQEDVFQILGTRGAGLAEYAQESAESLYVYIIKTSGRRSSIHQPEYCYLGSGKNELLAREKLPLVFSDGKHMRINRLLIQTAGGIQEVFYFYTANDQVTDNYYAQQLFFLWNRLHSVKVKGSLIRISRFLKNSSDSGSHINLQPIIHQLVASVNAHE